MWASEAILNYGLLLGIPIALLAGLVSFLSPCVLPLIPGYFGYIAGQLGESDYGYALGKGGGVQVTNRRKLTLGVFIFVLGFTTVFIAMNAAFGALGIWIIRWQDLIIRISGVVVILMALVFIGKFAFFQQTKKIATNAPAGYFGAYLLGIIFAIGWTPCMGPVLATINLLSLNSGSAVQGIILGAFYAIGLGIPFILLATGIGFASSAVGFFRKHVRVINLIGGLLMLILGLLMVTGYWTESMLWIQVVMPNVQTPL